MHVSTASTGGAGKVRRCGTLVTGAAGFIGSHLAETLDRGGHEVVGIDCFTDYYDPALKEENARGLDVLRLDLAEDELDFAGFDGVFHLAGQPGVRSFGDVFPLYLRRNVLASQRVFEAAARDGVRVVFASSSSVYGAAERYPTPGGHAAAAALAVRDHEARLRAARRRLRARVRRSTASCCATSTPSGRGSGPTWRSRASSSALAAGATFDALRRRRPVARLDVRRRRRRCDDRRRWRGGSGTYNVGGALEASLNETIELLERISGPPARGAPAARRCRATSGARAPTRPASGPSSAGRRGCRSRTGSARQWEWASTRVAAR